jgi:hypothetical protein
MGTIVGKQPYKNKRISLVLGKFANMPPELMEMIVKYASGDCLYKLAYTHPLIYLQIERALYNLLMLKYGRAHRLKPRVTIRILINLYYPIADKYIYGNAIHRLPYIPMYYDGDYVYVWQEQQRANVLV